MTTLGNGSSAPLEFLGNSVEQTKLRVAPGVVNSSTLSACPWSSSHRKPPGREIADAWDKEPPAPVGTTSAEGI